MLIDTLNSWDQLFVLEFNEYDYPFTFVGISRRALQSCNSRGQQK